MFGVLEPARPGANFRESLEVCGGIDPIDGGAFFALSMRRFGGSGVPPYCAGLARVVSIGWSYLASCSAPHRAGRSILVPSGDGAPVRFRL